MGRFLSWPKTIISWPQDGLSPDARTVPQVTLGRFPSLPQDWSLGDPRTGPQLTPGRVPSSHQDGSPPHPRTVPSWPQDRLSLDARKGLHVTSDGSPADPRTLHLFCFHFYITPSVAVRSFAFFFFLLFFLCLASIPYRIPNSSSSSTLQICQFLFVTVLQTYLSGCMTKTNCRFVWSLYSI